MKNFFNAPTNPAMAGTVAAVVAVLRTKQKQRQADELATGHTVEVLLTNAEGKTEYTLCPARVAARIRRILGEPQPGGSGLRWVFVHEGQSEEAEYGLVETLAANCALMAYLHASHRQLLRRIARNNALIRRERLSVANRGEVTL
ncbi:hypothetical protein [Hymenobacter baengnokdamensis]|uniref:hypothetical protein n=1 Tax=Hymenobacter baengnokdamensis TaxID=2615203 RepID=UPI0012492579|nr:hypothetical protein [Hymenobacter baengnokdamensis]